MALSNRASGLVAWANLMPPGPAKLHVRGWMRTSNLNDKVTLQPIAPAPDHPSVKRFRVEIATPGNIGLPALGLSPIEYIGPHESQFTAVELIFSDASKALIDEIKIVQ